jgi:hypothetical protein
MKKSVSIERIGLGVGLITSLALVSYFMIMKALGLAQIIELRFFNILIMAIGICTGIVRLKHKTQEHEFYLKGLAEGMIITVTAVVTFAIFMTVYLTQFNQPLMHEISTRVPYSGSMDGMVIFISIFMEGMASGAIITFAAMQYLKRVGTFKAEAE